MLSNYERMTEVKVLELFAGTRSIGKAFEKSGHEVFSIDWDEQHHQMDWYTDITTVTAEDIRKRFGEVDVIWASPDCTTYSVAGISHHRRKEQDTLRPISDKAVQADRVVQNVLALITELKPKYWFIENPRGGLRKMAFMQGLERHTVTYCQYGDSRMKPTDIWTNHKNPQFKEPCKNGMPCHVSAPRGSQTGTQGIKGSVDRSRIPMELCMAIVEMCEEEEREVE